MYRLANYMNENLSRYANSRAAGQENSPLFMKGPLPGSDAVEQISSSSWCWCWTEKMPWCSTLH